MLDLLLRNATIVPGPAAEAPFVGDLGVAEGRIALLRRRDQEDRPAAEAAETFDAAGHVVLPGFVNAHLHAVPSLLRGAFSAITIDEHVASPLVGRLYELLWNDREAVELGARLCLAEAVMAGATSVALMEYIDAAAALRVGAELGVGGSMSVYPKEEGWRETLEEIRARGFVPMLWAPNEDDPDFTDAFLREVLAHAQAEDVRVHMHVSETAARRDAVMRRHGVTPIANLARLGLLDRVYAVHCTVVSDADVELLAAHDAPVVITPTSEALLGDGVTPLAQLRAAGVTVALGTDGGPWAGSEDMLGEMKATALLNRAHGGPASITGADLIEMATVNGARVLGQHDRRGTLAVGMDADVVVLDARAAHLRPAFADGALATLRDVIAFAATAADVAWVIAGGRTLHRRERGSLLLAEETAAIEAAAHRLWHASGADSARSWHARDLPSFT